MSQALSNLGAGGSGIQGSGRAFGMGLAPGGGGLWNSLKNGFQGFGNFMSGAGGQNIMDFGSLALNAYGMDKSLGMAEDQLGIMKEQEGRAATAQNFQTNNSLAMQLQMTTPGTPEHEQVKRAIAESQYSV